MPLFTYVMTYKGVTKIHQSRRSNPTGWMASIAEEVFPELSQKPRALLGVLRSQELKPVASSTHVWELRCKGDESEFIAHIIETRS